MFRPRLRSLTLLLLPLALGFAACSSPAGGTAGSTATSTGNTQPPSTTTPEPHYKIGTQAPVGPWVITIDAYSSSGDNSYTPAAGKALLIFNISQQNRSSQAAAAGGAADWSLRDSTGVSLPVITQSGYGTFPAQNVAAGDTGTGIMVYEVPASEHQFTLTFAPAAGGSQAIWDVSI